MSAFRTALVDAAVAALPVALVYFSGWAYLSSYLAEFGIDATQVEIAFTTVLVYAFKPLQDCWVLVCLVVIILFFSALIVPKKLPGWLSAGSLMFACLIFYVLLLTVKNAADAQARAMAENVWINAKSITEAVVNVPATNPDPAYADYVACRDGYRLRQVIGLPNRLFLFCRSEHQPEMRGALFVVNDQGAIIYVADRRRKPEDAKKSTEN